MLIGADQVDGGGRIPQIARGQRAGDIVLIAQGKPCHGDAAFGQAVGRVGVDREQCEPVSQTVQQKPVAQRRVRAGRTGPRAGGSQGQRIGRVQW